MKKIFILFTFLMCFLTQSQTIPSKLTVKNYTLKGDTLRIDTVSISPKYLKIYNSNNHLINSELYSVNYPKALIVFNQAFSDSAVTVSYQKLPEFLTKKYAVLDEEIITDRTNDLTQLYDSNSGSKNKNSKLFDGLYTSGSLSRAVTIGNNQDAVVNSNFNLQIEGNLSNNVGIRASITDNNIPLQAGGYTQRLNEFDRVFIEMYGKNWNINAGDINLQNSKSFFMNFNKKVAGVYTDVVIDNALGETKVFASGALVRGKFTSYKFVGIEGNQGPYKILGENNEQYLLIVSGSETIYANGVPLKRGENFDYIIDYNLGEIVFTTLFRVNANIRFSIDFQVVENNYTRFVTYDGVELKSEKLEIGVKYYNETDSKNKSLNQDLTDEQKQILADAGNDQSKMISLSEQPQEYSENKILYKKVSDGSIEKYEYSNNPEDELFQVQFSYVGENKGDYIIETTLAPGRVYAYVNEIDNIKQGSYAPIIRLYAPEKLQMIDLEFAYNPNHKTSIKSELAFSNKDQNLFSTVDDENNNGYAGKLNWEQLIIDKDWKLKSHLDYEYISKNFNTIERYRNVEFSRDWDLQLNATSEYENQQYLVGGLSLQKENFGKVLYQFESLHFGDDFKGSRNVLFSNLYFDNTQINIEGSIMKNENITNSNSFNRWYSNVKHNFKKSWVGGKFNFENNQSKIIDTQILDPLNHKIIEIEGYTGVGDSTKVFVEVGYNYQKVDSVQNNSLENVNTAHTFFVNSKIINSKNADLSLYGNYRTVSNLNYDNDVSINARLIYRQNLLQNAISLNTIYETQSGVLPQQDFSYIEVEPGKGYYTWIDFNNNEIQELDEFVVAKFQDEATYVRVLLPNINYIKTHQNKFSQSLNINALKWQNQEGFKGVLSHFSDQAFFLINANERRDLDESNFNPFNIDDDDLMSLDLQIKNSLYFNRGRQKFSTGYIFLKSRKKSFYSIGDQDNEIKSHQLNFDHKLNSFWMISLNGASNTVTSKSVAYSNRNYKLDNYAITPKLIFAYNSNTRFEVFYNYKNKENRQTEFETLEMNVLGANFRYSSKDKISINSNFNWISNNYQGNKNSPVAYQMLEGLQPGMNMTWLLGLQKRLTSFLDLNINYFGRDSESSKTIHSGSVQLRASF